MMPGPIWLEGIGFMVIAFAYFALAIIIGIWVVRVWTGTSKLYYAVLDMAETLRGIRSVLVGMAKHKGKGAPI